MSGPDIKNLLSAYDVLSVDPETANDAVIRRAYLALAKRYSPDTDPDRFQLIRLAYEQISTEENRLSYVLFECPAIGLLDCINAVTKDKGSKLPTSKLLYDVLIEAMNE